MPSTAVNNVDRISSKEMKVQNPCPPLRWAELSRSSPRCLRARQQWHQLGVTFSSNRPAYKSIRKGIDFLLFSDLYTGTGGLCQGDISELRNGLLPTRSPVLTWTRAALQQEITVTATLGIGIGEEYFGYGPEVEYDVKREYSPDESSVELTSWFCSSAQCSPGPLWWSRFQRKH